jgi:hypothetical protein
MATAAPVDWKLATLGVALAATEPVALAEAVLLD